MDSGAKRNTHERNREFFRRGLRLDPEKETARICRSLREIMRDQVRRRGLVVGLSGGVDSSVTAALAVRALGRSVFWGWRCLNGIRQMKPCD